MYQGIEILIVKSVIDVLSFKIHRFKIQFTTSKYDQERRN